MAKIQGWTWRFKAEIHATLMSFNGESGSMCEVCGSNANGVTFQWINEDIRLHRSVESQG